MQQINNNLRYDSCPLCKGVSITLQGKIRESALTYYSTTEIKLLNQPELWQCEQCKSSFTQNVVSEEDSVKLYSQSSSEERWAKLPFIEAKTSPVVAKLTSILNPGYRVLDIGCGSGNFLDFAKDIGCKTYGVEYSCTSLELIINNGHIGFSNFSEVNETFDVITAFDVLEHLYDLSAFLKACTSLLSSNGYLVFLTGDITCKASKSAKADWWYVQYPEHIVFPTKTFFMNYPELRITDWIETYHTPSVHNNFMLNLLRTCFNILRRRTYIGVPSFTPDHYLVVLKNNK